MRLALTHGILCFNVESIPELHRLNEVAGGMGKRAPRVAARESRTWTPRPIRTSPPA